MKDCLAPPADAWVFYMAVLSLGGIYSQWLGQVSAGSGVSMFGYHGVGGLLEEGAYDEIL